MQAVPNRLEREALVAQLVHPTNGLAYDAGDHAAYLTALRDQLPQAVGQSMALGEHLRLVLRLQDPPFPPSQQNEDLHRVIPLKFVFTVVDQRNDTPVVVHTPREPLMHLPDMALDGTFLINGRRLRLLKQERRVSNQIMVRQVDDGWQAKIWSATGLAGTSPCAVHYSPTKYEWTVSWPRWDLICALFFLLVSPCPAHRFKHHKNAAGEEHPADPAKLLKRRQPTQQLRPRDSVPLAHVFNALGMWPVVVPPHARAGRVWQHTRATDAQPEPNLNVDGLLPHLGHNGVHKAQRLGHMVEALLRQKADNWHDPVWRRVAGPAELVMGLVSFTVRRHMFSCVAQLSKWVNKQNASVPRATWPWGRSLDRLASCTPALLYAFRTGRWARENTMHIVVRDEPGHVDLGRRLMRPDHHERATSLEPRLPHGNGYHYICPISTPDNARVGLTGQLASGAVMSTGILQPSHQERVQAWVTHALDPLPANTGTRARPVFVQGVPMLGGRRVNADAAYQALSRGRPYPLLQVFATPYGMHVTGEQGELFAVALPRDPGDAAMRACPAWGTTTLVGAIQAGRLCLLGMQEAARHAYVAETPAQLDARHTHLHLHPMLALGAAVSQQAFGNYCPGARLAKAAHTQGQALHAAPVTGGFGPTEDWLVHPQVPSVSTMSTRVHDPDRQGTRRALVQNAVVVVLNMASWNVEDAVVMSQDAADRGFGMRVEVRRTLSQPRAPYQKVGLPANLNASHAALQRPADAPGETPHCGCGAEAFWTPDNERGCKYSQPERESTRHTVTTARHLGVVPVGVAPPGSSLDTGDMTVGIVDNLKSKPRDCSTRSGRGRKRVVSQAVVPYSQLAQQEAVNQGLDPEQLPLVVCTTTTRTVPAQIGDKMVLPGLQKCSVSLAPSAGDLPYALSNGVTGDLFLNPCAFNSRRTVNFMLESLLGTAASCAGHSPEHTDGTPFRDFRECEDYVADALRAAGMCGTGSDTFVDGHTGDVIGRGAVFHGLLPVIQPAPHFAERKARAVTSGKVDPYTRQSVHGFRCGEMERQAIMAQGALDVVLERTRNMADDHVALICATCGLLARDVTTCHRCPPAQAAVHQVACTYAVHLLAQELMACNIALRFELDAVASDAPALPPPPAAVVVKWLERLHHALQAQPAPARPPTDADRVCVDLHQAALRFAEDAPFHTDPEPMRQSLAQEWYQLLHPEHEPMEHLAENCPCVLRERPVLHAFLRQHMPPRFTPAHLCQLQDMVDTMGVALTEPLRRALLCSHSADWVGLDEASRQRRHTLAAILRDDILPLPSRFHVETLRTYLLYPVPPQQDEPSTEEEEAPEELTEEEEAPEELTEEEEEEEEKAAPGKRKKHKHKKKRKKHKRKHRRHEKEDEVGSLTLTEARIAHLLGHDLVDLSAPLATYVPPGSEDEEDEDFDLTVHVSPPPSPQRRIRRVRGRRRLRRTVVDSSEEDSDGGRVLELPEPCEEVKGPRQRRPVARLEPTWDADEEQEAGAEDLMEGGDDDDDEDEDEDASDTLGGFIVKEYDE
jgi:DNA-directed RNA polymerase subunit B'